MTEKFKKKGFCAYINEEYGLHLATVTLVLNNFFLIKTI